MPHDEELAHRLRSALGGLPGVAERRMMGGVCFMVEGNMLGGARRDRDGVRRFMFRVGREQEPAALLRPGAERVTLGRRPMPGFVHVGAGEVDDAELAEWVSMALAYVGSLPAKGPAGS